jgi:hypothetical protein
MNQTRQSRILRAITALAIVCSLLFLLFPHAIGSHSAPLFWLALSSVLVFAILDIPSSQRLPVQVVCSATLRKPFISARFQRPPPSI